MATVYGKFAKEIKDNGKINALYVKSRAYIMYEEITLDGQAIGDIIILGAPIPINHIIHTIAISTSVSLSTTELDIGTEDEPHKYVDGFTLTETTKNHYVGNFDAVKALEKDTQLQLKIKIKKLPASGTLRISVIYSGT